MREVGVVILEWTDTGMHEDCRPKPRSPLQTLLDAPSAACMHSEAARPCVTTHVRVEDLDVPH